MVTMTNYEVDYSYKMEEYGTLPVNADSVEDAEQQTLDYVRETYPDNLGIEIETVREIQAAA